MKWLLDQHQIQNKNSIIHSVFTAEAKEPFSCNNWLQHIEPVIIFVEEKNGSLKSEYNFQQLTTKYDTRIQPEKKKIEKILQDYCSEN